MPSSLLQRPVRRRSPEVRLSGRILYLVDDPELVTAQLAGRDLDWDPSIRLRDNISTDEITPAYICYYFDETLGEFPYLGLKAGGSFPVTRGSVKAGGFVASVAGKRRGKGSSREQSPYAEMCAGIRLVVGESIERIYRENCQNLGILTTTDFSILDRIQRGETIPLAAFTDGEGQITRDIIEFGGLFNYNVARLQGRVTVPALATPKRPMTIAEKSSRDTGSRTPRRGAPGRRPSSRETKGSSSPTSASVTSTSRRWPRSSSTSCWARASRSPIRPPCSSSVTT